MALTPTKGKKVLEVLPAITNGKNEELTRGFDVMDRYTKELIGSSEVYKLRPSFTAEQMGKITRAAEILSGSETRSSDPKEGRRNDVQILQANGITLNDLAESCVLYAIAGESEAGADNLETSANKFRAKYPCFTITPLGGTNFMDPTLGLIVRIDSLTNQGNVEEAIHDLIYKGSNQLVLDVGKIKELSGQFKEGALAVA